MKYIYKYKLLSLINKDGSYQTVPSYTHDHKKQAHLNSWMTKKTSFSSLSALACDSYASSLFSCREALAVSATCLSKTSEVHIINQNCKSNKIVGRMFALQLAYPGSISGILYGLLRQPGIISKHKARNNPKEPLGVAPKINT